MAICWPQKLPESMAAIPPWSVASLMQRVGRSGRKEDQGQFLYLFTIDHELSAQSPVSDRLHPELIRGIALIELLIARWVESSSGGCQRFNYSTFIHQVLSVLRQTGGLKVTALYEQLCERGAFDRINRNDFILLLRNLKEKALIEQMASGEIILAPTGEQIVEDRNFYAAFATAIEYSVEYAGESIGVLPSDSIPQPEEAILLAGRRWQVQLVCHAQHRISVVPAKGKNPPRFSGLAGQIDPRVMHKMREILAGERTYSYLNPQAAEMLGAARAVFERTGLAVQNVIATRSSTVWFPWAGTRTHEALSVLAALDHIQVRKDLISLTYDNCPQGTLWDGCLWRTNVWRPKPRRDPDGARPV